jgi:hypothetical protein
MKVSAKVFIFLPSLVIVVAFIWKGELVEAKKVSADHKIEMKNKMSIEEFFN